MLSGVPARQAIWHVHQEHGGTANDQAPPGCCVHGNDSSCWDTTLGHPPVMPDCSAHTCLARKQGLFEALRFFHKCAGHVGMHNMARPFATIRHPKAPTHQRTGSTTNVPVQRVSRVLQIPFVVQHISSCLRHQKHATASLWARAWPHMVFGKNLMRWALMSPAMPLASDGSGIGPACTRAPFRGCADVTCI